MLLRVAYVLAFCLAPLVASSPALGGFDAAKIGIPVVEVGNAVEVLRGMLILDNQGHVLGTVDDVACGWLDERVARVRIKLSDGAMAGHSVWLPSDVLRFDVARHKIVTRMNESEVHAKAAGASVP